MTEPERTSLFGQLDGHEQVVHFHDPKSGLRAIVAIHSTALGPALGGTRYRHYPDEPAALTDVLRLSAAMTAKNALAGLDHGGGKAVILAPAGGRPDEPLLRAYGRFIDTLGGRYITAGDMGISSDHLDLVGRETRFVTGRTVAHGGGGDSGILTALGVYQGMRACAAHRWGEPTLAGRTVGVLGLGKVGRRLVEHLLDEGAQVVAADVDADVVGAMGRAHPEVEIVPTAELLVRPLDVLSPNAAGGLLDDATVAALRVDVVCGGANNQLLSSDMADLLAARDVLYAPDYLVNAGGVIQVADEWQGFQPERAEAAARGIFDTTTRVLALAAARSITPLAAADELVRERIAAVSRLGTIWNPTR